MIKLQKALRSTFAAGLVVLAPIGLTLWMLKFLISWADAILKVKNGRFFYVIPQQYHPDQLFGSHLPGLNLIVTIFIILIVGVLTRNFVGRGLVRFGERLLNKIPFIRTVYRSAKQLLGTILDESSMNFREVVLFEYPRKGIYTIAFITGNSFEAAQQQFDKKLLSVFVPTTPNPTSGFFMMVPEDEVIPLDITPEDGFKLIVSFGIVAPEREAVASN